LKRNLVLKASDEGIVVEWWSAPKWHLLEGYISIGLTLHGSCDGGDNLLSRPRLFLDETIWRLLHQTQGYYFEFGT
jgi:hypothetical protein